MCNSRRYHKTFVVTVDHDNDAERASRESPRVLVGKPMLVGVGIFKRDVEHLGEVLTEMVRRCCLHYTEQLNIVRALLLILLLCFQTKWSIFWDLFQVRSGKNFTDQTLHESNLWNLWNIFIRHMCCGLHEDELLILKQRNVIRK